MQPHQQRCIIARHKDLKPEGKMKKWLFSIFAFLLFVNISQAKNQTLFSEYNIASATYVYNEDGDAGANDGWVNARLHTGKGIVVEIATFNATSITVGIEGREYDTTDQQWRSYVIYEKAYTATNSGDKIVVVENCDEIRVGLKIAGDTGTQSVTVSYDRYGRN